MLSTCSVSCSTVVILRSTVVSSFLRTRCFGMQDNLAFEAFSKSLTTFSFTWVNTVSGSFIIRRATVRITGSSKAGFPLRLRRERRYAGHADSRSPCVRRSRSTIPMDSSVWKSCNCRKAFVVSITFWQPPIGFDHIIGEDQWVEAVVDTVESIPSMNRDRLGGPLRGYLYILLREGCRCFYQLVVPDMGVGIVVP